MKKMLALILALATVLSLTACGGKTEGNTSQPAEDNQSSAETAATVDDVDLKELAANYDGEIHVTIWGKDSVDPEKTTSRGTFIAKKVDEFNAQFSNVNVEYIYQGSYDEVAEKIRAAAAAKDLPTMFMTEEAMVKGFQDIAADLNQYIPSATIQNYQQGLLVSMKGDNGQLLAAPFARSLPVLYVNKELLEQAGWNGADIKTNEDLMQCAKDVKEKTGAYGFCTFWDSDAWHWESAIYADGGSVLSEDGSKPTIGKDYDYVGAKYLKLVQKGLKEGYIFSPYGTPKPADTRDDMFCSGQAAMTLTSCNSMPKRADKLAESGYTLETYIQPAGDNGEPSLASGGSNWVICDSASYEEKMIAGGFLAYLAQDDNIVENAELTGSMMITESALVSDGGKKLLAEKPYFQTIYDSVPYLHARPNTPYWTEMYTYAVDKLEQFTLNYATTDVNSMIDDIETKFQSIIDDNAW